MCFGRFRCAKAVKKDDQVQLLGLKGVTLKQGSLHYTPEHCLVNGGVPLFWSKKPHVSNGCKMYLLRSPVKIALLTANETPLPIVLRFLYKIHG